MNNNTAVMVAQEIEGIKPFGSKKFKKKRNFNPKLCPELEMIGRHIANEEGKCRYCKVEVL